MYEKLKAKWQKEKLEKEHRANAVKALLKNQCTSIYKKYGVTKVILFGSVSTSRVSTTSDLDIYAHPLDISYIWQFQRDLEDILEINVDLHTQRRCCIHK